MNHETFLFYLSLKKTFVEIKVQMKFGEQKQNILEAAKKTESQLPRIDFSWAKKLSVLKCTLKSFYLVRVKY